MIHEKRFSGQIDQISAPARKRRSLEWQRWMPYAAVIWSLVYAALGLAWALSGRGFPYRTMTGSAGMAPVAGMFGPVVAWAIVVAEGIPAAVVGMLMLRGVRRFRPFLIAAGILIGGVLLFLMIDLGLLTSLAYLPFVLFKLITGSDISPYVHGVFTWMFAHQLFCLAGGFLWLGATLRYTRRSGDACLNCGRRDGPEGWKDPASAMRWGRIAVYVAMIAPVFYACTRYAWALGIPWGMTEEHLRQGQESGTWIAGLSLANFGLVGALLMLGLVQRWGEVFPRWMIGLAGRKVPVALAVIPAAIVSVLFVVGGISIWSGYNQWIANAASLQQNFWIFVGPTLLFPLWGIALAVATLGYYYRRRGPCAICGRGVPGKM